MTVSVRQIGGGSDHGAADSRIGALSSAADPGSMLVVTGASPFEAAIETESAPVLDGESPAPANDPLMRAIEIGLAGLAFGSAVLLAFMR